MINCLTIVKDFDEIKDFERIEIIKKEGKYGFGYGAQVLSKLSNGDNICFYLKSTQKIVLSAEVVSSPSRNVVPPDHRIPERYYNAEIKLANVKDVEPPVDLTDERVRSDLNAFKAGGISFDIKNWGNFVLGSKNIEISDFDKLTNSNNLSNRINDNLVLNNEYSLKDIEYVFGHDYGYQPKGIVRKPQKNLIILIAVDYSDYDNEYFDDCICYVGEDFKDKSKDQVMKWGNKVLKLSNEKKETIYGFRQKEKNGPYIYLGMLSVLNYFEDRNENGKRIFRFLLERKGLEVTTDSNSNEFEELPILKQTKDRKKVKTTVVARNSVFREKVKKIYDNTCAVCGKRRLNLVGYPEVEAAHILPVKMNGSDNLRNGIALCRLHHWAFDNGLFSIDNDYKIIVNDEIKVDKNYKEIYEYENELIFLPKKREFYPYKGCLNKHRKYHGFY